MIRQMLNDYLRKSIDTAISRYESSDLTAIKVSWAGLIEGQNSTPPPPKRIWICFLIVQSLHMSC